MNGTRLIYLLAGWSLMLLPPQAAADDWPQWMGPRRDSVWRESGIVRELPPGGPPIRWKIEIGGGYAGPAVSAGRVFLADFVSQQEYHPNANARNQRPGKERILCLSAGDGSLLWKYETDCTYDISYPAGPRVTPTVDGDRVYALGAMGNLVCLNAADGQALWSRDLKKDYHVPAPMWGFCGHPLVDGNRLICLVGGEGSVAVAFDKHTGKEIWRALSAREPGYCPPTMIDAGGRRQLLIWDAESLHSLDPRTGRPYWSEPLAPDYGMSIVAPRQRGSYLFVSGIVNKGLMLRLDDRKPAATVLWAVAKDIGIGPVSSPPFLEDEYLYGVDREGELRCVRLRDGRHEWSTYDATTGNRRLSSATAFLVKHEDRFFIFNERGELIIARLTPAGYEEVSRAKILDPLTSVFGARKVVWSHPAFANRCMFARNDKNLVCVSLAAGRP